MFLLIDGHNLIGQMPSLRMDDPDDEAKLVALLRVYRVREQRRAKRPPSITVVFDGGLPGGHSPELSGGGVDVIFAFAGRNADSILCERIRGARDPRQLMVVSSDREIIAAAKVKRVRVMRAEVFAARIKEPSETSEPAQEKTLSPEEIEEWLHIFGEE
jgi:predicted RNA-binding protein with PIN domain